MYLEQNIDNPRVMSWAKDTVWTLSVKIIDLNTNLHNPNVREMLKYSRETFVTQCMKFPEFKDAFSEQEMADLYDRIQRHQFENKISLHERYFKRINEMSYSLV